MGKKQKSQAEIDLKNQKKCRRWFRFLRVLAFFVRIVCPCKKYGHKKAFKDRNYLFVGNHRSLLDVLPVVIATKSSVHFIAKKELWDGKFLGWFATKSQAIPVSRDGNDVRAVMSSIKYLKNGENVAIFPEGTRNKTEDMFLPFKSGAAALSIKTKTPVVPVVCTKKVKPFRIHRVYYGEPYEFKEFYDKKLTEAEMQAADEKLKEIMTDAYRELENLTRRKKDKS